MKYNFVIFRSYINKFNPEMLFQGFEFIYNLKIFI